MDDSRRTPHSESSPEAYLDRFGISSFRPGQREVIQSVLDGDDCLCIMPTGGGKSLCYQLPSLMTEGVTLVVSPLIALMKDQVDALNERGISAAFINSSLSPSEQSERLRQLASRDVRLMYVAPERFRSPRFLDAVRDAKIPLLAIDEAHCISEWGHDFRHDYARLGEFREQLGNPQTIALTATATEDVRQDVIVQLRLQDPKTFVAGFARPNLHYEVLVQNTLAEKLATLRTTIDEASGCGIVYASTRKSCEEVAEMLRMARCGRVVVYHGGMAADDRRRVQDEFMSGRADIVVATNAFGMGIDKPDVRFVIHYNLPGSLEAYYQEAGRAGRDGLPSQCLLLYSAGDRYVQEFFIDSAFPPRDVVRKVYEFLRVNAVDALEMTQEQLRNELGLSIGSDGVGTCERLLEKCGVLDRLEAHQNMAAVRIQSDLPTLVDLLPKNATTQRKVLRSLERIVGQRRSTFVYLHPDRVADQAEITLPAFGRAMRELSSLRAITYLPPFRGRAVRMARTDLEFDELGIDFAALEARRQANLDKLQQVVSYATTRQRCRQQMILRYFGDNSDEACGHCDHCDRKELRGATEISVESSDEMQRTVKKVLSGIARGRGRFGRQLIAAMLCGSKSAKIQRWKLDQLSTFGVLQGLTQVDVQELIDALIEADCIHQSDVDRFRPVLTLTPTGRDVMTGKQLPSKLVVSNRLQSKVVVQERIAMASAPRAEKVALVTETGDATSSGRQPSSATAVDPPGQMQPDFYWTWRLLSDGYAMADCVSMRRLEEGRLIDHLIQAAEYGLPVDPGWVLSSDLVDQLDASPQKLTVEEARQLSAHRAAEISAPHLRLFYRCRQARTPDGTKTFGE